MSDQENLGSTPPPVKVPRVGKLDTLVGIRQELGRLYKASRRREGENPSASTAAKLGYLLYSLAQIISTAELEARVKELEQRIGGEN